MKKRTIIRIAAGVIAIALFSTQNYKVAKSILAVVAYDCFCEAIDEQTDKNRSYKK